MVFDIQFQLAELQLAGFCSFEFDKTNGSKNSSVAKTDAPLILMLHGWQDNAATFIPLIQHLRPYYQMIAVDLPGHGLSHHRSTDNFYHFVDYLDDIAQLVEQLSSTEQPIILLGHSLGAIIANSIGAMMPEHIQAVIAIEGLTPLFESESNTLKRLQKGVASRKLSRRRLQREPKGFLSFSEALAMRAKANQLQPELLEQVVERGCYLDQQDWFWRHDPKLRCESLFRMSSNQVKNIIEGIECPVFSIVGEHGFDYLRAPQTSHSWFRNLEQVQVKGGHHCHLESSEAVAHYVKEFISKT
ncbi:TPA: alpha/beta fold hydrolase [Photobacterium damselae]